MKMVSKTQKILMLIKFAKKIIKINEKRKKIKSSFKNVHRLQQTIRLAQKMGKSLGRSKIL